MMFRTIFVSLCCVQAIQSQDLQKQISMAEVGDTLLLTGLYKVAELYVDKPISLVGDAIIDGQSKGSVLIIKANDVHVSGLFFTGVGHSYTEDYAAIKIIESSNISIENTTIENAFFGIHIEKSKDVRINNNYIDGKAINQHNSGNGIHAWHSENLSITGNHLQHLRDGIYFEFVSNSQISNNKSVDNIRYGLHFMFANNNTYYHNLFQYNGSGCAVMFSKEIKMNANRFLNSLGAHAYGLLLKEVTDLVIENNRFEHNTIGINAEGLNRIQYLNNTFYANGWAIKFRGACYTNLFRKNNFLYNTFDVSYSGEVYDNKFELNYWSQYNGYDLDKDNIGDLPYQPVKLFSVLVNKTPETLILLKSLFVETLNYAEKIVPVFTPNKLKDYQPVLLPYPYD